ncbi:MAG: CHAT domain-containing protein [Saprospiraceae bacterium]|nr:CHAT domain-containing protein [Saprospiraceae bacterium]
MKTFPICLLLIFFCTCFPQVFFAQSPGLPTEIFSARQLLNEAQLLFDSAKYESAGQYAEGAYLFFKANPEVLRDLAQAGYIAGKAAYAQKNYARARSFLNESLNNWLVIKPDGSIEEAKSRLALGNTLQRLDDMTNAMEQGQKTIALLDQLEIETGPERFDALRLIGRVLYGTGQYNKAIPYYEEALILARLHYKKENTEMALMMLYLGNCYNYCGALERAIATLERALAIQQKEQLPIPEEIAGVYMALGACQQALKKYELALDCYEKAIAIRSQIDGGKNVRLAYGYSKIGQISIEKNEFEKALESFQKSDEILRYNKAENDAAYAYTCRDFGLAYFSLKRYDEAIRWLEKAWTIFQGPEPAKGSGMGLDQCSVIFQIGRAQSASGDYEAALQSFARNQKMLEQLFGFDYPLFYETNAEIANTYAKLYRKTGQALFLEQSRAYFRLAANGVNQQLQNKVRQGSERIVLAEALPYFENAIRTELLYLKTQPGDETALESAWQLSEAMHAQLLLSAVQEANARHFAGIPDAELLRDSVLQSQISSLQKAREGLAEQGREITDSLVLATNAHIFALKEEVRALRAAFEKNYPDYFRLKYEVRASTLAETRKMLSPQQTLLEYFTGDSSIFIFVLQAERSRVLEIPRDFPLLEWTQALREGISAYHTAAQKTPTLYKKTVLQYADAAQKLYQKLLAPIAESLTPEIIIVPGDGLANLPFEALLTATPKDPGNFKTYKFLLRQHSVHYAYSATMLQQMVARTHRHAPTGGLLAFAPFFEEDTTSLSLRLQREEAVRRELSALPFSGEEIFRAKKHFGKKSVVLTGKEASKQKFLESVARFSILHLATHGKANHQEGDFSYLAFASDDENVENGLLSVGELYNLSLNADLVLLSACETGIGEQQRGEGVVSLARAFAFAGAKSIVATLWSVNDKSTMQVMDNFYAGIKSGKPKNVALANAKLQYLEKNPGQPSHPFFWAGFVAVGDMSPMKQ